MSNAPSRRELENQWQPFSFKMNIKINCKQNGMEDGNHRRFCMGDGGHHLAITPFAWEVKLKQS